METAYSEVYVELEAKKRGLVPIGLVGRWSQKGCATDFRFDKNGNVLRR